MCSTILHTYVGKKVLNSSYTCIRIKSKIYQPLWRERKENLDIETNARKKDLQMNMNMTTSMSGSQENNSISHFDVDGSCGFIKDESKSSETNGDSSTSCCTDRDSNISNGVAQPSISMAVTSAVTTKTLDDKKASATIVKKKDKKHSTRSGIKNMNKLTKTEKCILSEQGYTRGLLDALETNRNEFLYSIWITDNSLSMNVVDGHRIDPVLCNRTSQDGSNNGGGGGVTFTTCSRWEEIQQTIDYHAQMAAIVKAPTMFHFTNEPQYSSDAHSQQQRKQQQNKRLLQQQFTIFDILNNTKSSTSNSKHRYEDLEVAQRTIKATVPSGKCTPLTETIRNVRDTIIPRVLSSTTTGSNENDTDSKRIVLVIATDGILADVDENVPATEAAKDEFIQTIQSLKHLPVWIVVRLCTDDDSVVEYWNNMNLDGIELDVLDDYVSEAKEVYAHNTWLNYGLPLHRLREMGFYDDVFDLLDERTLNRKEIIDFCTILLGKSVMSKAPNVYPNRDDDTNNNNTNDVVDDNDCSYRSIGASQRGSDIWDEFCYFVEVQLQKEIKIWNPIRKNIESWINIKELRKIKDDQQQQQQPSRRLLNPRDIFRSTLAFANSNINKNTINSPTRLSLESTNTTTGSNCKGVAKIISSIGQFVTASPMKIRNRLKPSSPTNTQQQQQQSFNDKLTKDGDHTDRRRFSLY